MKKILKFGQLNENSSEMSLLNNLFNFYYIKYKNDNDELEKHFVDVAKTLVKKGEITEKSLNKFCKEKGIKLEEDGYDIAKNIQGKRKYLKIKYSDTNDSCGMSSPSSSCGNTSGSSSYC